MKVHLSEVGAEVSKETIQSICQAIINVVPSAEVTIEVGNEYFFGRAVAEDALKKYKNWRKKAGI